MIIICDRFTDSTLAYQIYGKDVNKKFVDVIHNNILKNVKPNLTYVLKCKISKSMDRINKRKTKNRYDKFSMKFYSKVQNAFIKIASKDKKKYLVVDNSNNDNSSEQKIFNKFLKKFK